MKRSLSQKGFKLTELLLVVAILVLLAGIVWVASHSVREGAARTHCMQNLRQIAIATHQYTADYQIIYQTPLSLRKYIRNRGVGNAESIFRCPRDRLYMPIHKTLSSYQYMGFSLAALNETARGKKFNTIVDEYPNKVMYICNHHFGLPVVWDGTRAEYDLTSKPKWPFLIVLRLDGSVGTVHSCQVRQKRGSFLGRPAYEQVYPGEEGYEQAEKSVLYPWCR
jgi:type II secretory pathway pseudopilin PulG